MTSLLRTSTRAAACAACLVTAPLTHSAAADAHPIGTVAIEASIDSSRLAPAVRIVPPETVVNTTSDAPVPFTNASTCRTDVAGAIATMSIPSISYACPVYGGGQVQMDAGEATWVTDVAANTVLTTRAGGSGTLWLAGHHTSHGGAFAAIPDLADGAVVTVADATGSASYRIVGRAYVEVRDDMVVDVTGTPTNAATVSALLRQDQGGDHAARLVIQTCDGEAHRWMLYGDLII